MTYRERTRIPDPDEPIRLLDRPRSTPLASEFVCWAVGLAIAVLCIGIVGHVASNAPRCTPSSPKGPTIGGVIKLYGC
jgi:hypothetical protein